MRVERSQAWNRGHFFSNLMVTSNNLVVHCMPNALASTPCFGHSVTVTYLPGKDDHELMILRHYQVLLHTCE